ncbi:cytochrome c biogenesis protein ResB [Desulfogranum mediterraneum]|uniref:cytochrome c biogenesis protein ResB n=1 Tax=Desulfogranum mediterraneum TaxID=160661 RepID=UPI00041CDAE3|nr:cytochrome c biogenesis protein ResB [Desulfogranum mediterraneum]
MTKTSKNPLLAFFSSVQLALFLLFLMAGTSIIGTIIPQNAPPGRYLEQYGAKMARFMELLNLTDMYNSRWFLLLLLLFALNLIVCSLERIPQVIKIIKRDNLDTSADRLEKMGLRARVTLPGGAQEGEAHIRKVFQQQGWKPQQRQQKDGTLFFAEKGAWTRFGVYIVHLSILIVLLGALIGSSTVAKKLLRDPSFAFKGSVMIPESRQSEVIYAFKSGTPIELGFGVRCDYFTIEYYPNGMPKTYLSKVTVVEDGAEVLSTDIKVNSPLTYKGITFYQSSYQPYQDYVVTLQKGAAELQTSSIIPHSQQQQWSEAGITYGIINRENRGEVTRRVKVWLSDGQGEPSIFWVNLGQEALVERPSGSYTFQAKQLYATGLQVTKDPGVWLVYGGCILMLIGLYVAFFMSHRKLFAMLRSDGSSATILFAGSANKNKVGFEKKFEDLAGTNR